MGQVSRTIFVQPYNGKVFDLIDTCNFLFITDYDYLDKEIILGPGNNIKPGGTRNRKTVTSIAVLKTTFEDFISAVIQILNEVKIDIVGLAITINGKEGRIYPPIQSGSFDFSISASEKELLAEQLVFDMLFDKYIKESELMTRNGYSTYLSRILYGDDGQRADRIPGINESLVRGMKDHYNMMKYSELRTQLEMMGVDPDKYDEYYNPKMRDNSSKKKPKFIWDWFQYNYGRSPRAPDSDDGYDFQILYGHSTITSRQYRRQLTRDSRNYSYETIFTDLKAYHTFVNKLLPQDNYSTKKYFNMSMDYYVLESYKRVDFIFKLMSILPQKVLTGIDKDHFLVRRFHPCVLAPHTKDGKLSYSTKHKYYRPLFMAEDALHKQMQEDSNPDDSIYGIRLQKYQIIRAKAYELFKYHCTFSSDDYIEIKDFLRQCYDMRKYHQSNTFWDLIQDAEWKDMDKKTKVQVKERIQHFLSINDAFFWKSADRDYTIPKNE